MNFGVRYEVGKFYKAAKAQTSQSPKSSQRVISLSPGTFLRHHRTGRVRSQWNVDAILPCCFQICQLQGASNLDVKSINKHLQAQPLTDPGSFSWRRIPQKSEICDVFVVSWCRVEFHTFNILKSLEAPCVTCQAWTSKKRTAFWPQAQISVSLTPCPLLLMSRPSFYVK